MLSVSPPLCHYHTRCPASANENISRLRIVTSLFGLPLGFGYVAIKLFLRESTTKVSTNDLTSSGYVN